MSLASGFGVVEVACGMGDDVVERWAYWYVGCSLVMVIYLVERSTSRVTHLSFALSSSVRTVPASESCKIVEHGFWLSLSVAAFPLKLVAACSHEKRLFDKGIRT